MTATVMVFPDVPVLILYLRVEAGIATDIMFVQLE